MDGGVPGIVQFRSLVGPGPVTTSRSRWSQSGPGSVRSVDSVSSYLLGERRSRSPAVDPRRLRGPGFRHHGPSRRSSGKGPVFCESCLGSRGSEEEGTEDGRWDQNTSYLRGGMGTSSGVEGILCIIDPGSISGPQGHPWVPGRSGMVSVL